MAHDLVSALPARDKDGGGHTFVRLRAGDSVAPLVVLASASDEPDYGLDLNLWEDTPSEWGARYGFGQIPFGNPNLEFSTQAPFHMGYYHESSTIYMAAGFLKRTYPLLRIHQYAGLSELAFRTGHPYWGWRFAGLARATFFGAGAAFYASCLKADVRPAEVADLSALRAVGSTATMAVSWASAALQPRLQQSSTASWGIARGALDFFWMFMVSPFLRSLSEAANMPTPSDMRADVSDVLYLLLLLTQCCVRRAGAAPQNAGCLHRPEGATAGPGASQPVHSTPHSETLP